MNIRLANFSLSAPDALWRIIGRPVFALGIAALSLNLNAAPHEAKPDEIEIGRRIYMEGVLPSGRALQGRRMDSVQVEGQAAACESCHRRSGMGSLEGNIVVPPITGNFLFVVDESRPVALVDPREAKNVTRPHAPYTELAFSKALKEGVNVSNRAMNPLMPKYELSEMETKALMAYLAQLSAEVSPGVTADAVHFATIVTPEVSKAQRDALVAMIQTAFKQRNASQESYSGRMRMPLDLIPRTRRNWEVTLWELTGEPATWPAQLAEYYQREPVFAVLSGISKSTWEPVDAFCQQQKLPCLLPSIAVSPAKTGFYGVYYSRGVRLEAEVLARYLRGLGNDKPKRLVQVHRQDEAGLAAINSATQALRESGIEVENRVFDGSETSAKQVLAGLAKGDAAMLWLPADDISLLNRLHPKTPEAPLFVSGLLTADNFAFAKNDWQAQLKVVYPYELGKVREKNASTLKSWLRTWKLPVVDEAMQTDVFFNLLFLTDLSSQMLDNLFRDYLIERAEDMLSFGSNLSAYPHLSLSRGQRFASKGAYIAHITAEGKLVADSDWLLP